MSKKKIRGYLLNDRPFEILAWYNSIAQYVGALLRILGRQDNNITGRSSDALPLGTPAIAAPAFYSAKSR